MTNIKNTTNQYNKKNYIDTYYNFGLNIYKAYSYGDSKTAGILASTLLIDQKLSDSYQFTKNYFSLSAFWVGLAYKAINNINHSSGISSKYKIIFKAGISLSAIAMVFKGPDIFAQKSNIQESAKLIKFVMNFLDNKGDIKRAEESFKDGYIAGSKHLLFNSGALISNNFIKTLLLKEVLGITNLVLHQKIFNYIPANHIVSFQAKDSAEPMKFLLKIASLKTMNFFSNIIMHKLQKISNDQIEKDLQEKIAGILLQPNNIQAILKLGNKANNFNENIKFLYSQSESEISSIFSNILTPLLIKNNIMDLISGVGQLPIAKILDNYSHLMFFNIMQRFILSQDHIMDFITLFWDLENKIQNISDDNDIMGELNMGGMKISVGSTLPRYIESNLQEIAKLGGQAFALEKLLQYISTSKNTKGSDNYIQQIPVFIADILNSFFETLFLVSGNITHLELSQIKFALDKVDREFGLYNSGNGVNSNARMISTFSNTEKETPESLDILLEELKGMNSYGALRKISNERMLKISDYKLQSQGEGTGQFLKINELSLSASNIYAIIGKNGVGKTTFLDDVAKCSSPLLYNSSGVISYPSHEGVELPMIFRPTTPFKLPKTSLLERMTYQIPTAEREVMQESLVNRALELFEIVGQREKFNNKMLLEKKSDHLLALSKGQEQIAMLIGVILYKEYLKKPVMLVLDESFGHIDSDTKISLQEQIQKLFQDSIIISVDHHTTQSRNFYNEIINLEQYSSLYNKGLSADTPVLGDDGSDMSILD